MTNKNANKGQQQQQANTDKADTLTQTQETPTKQAGELKVASQQPTTEVAVGQQAVDKLAGLSKEDADAVRLIESLLGEYTSSISKGSDLGDASRGHYGKLHGAYRNMMDLRGGAHRAAAHVFLEAFKEHGKKALDYDMRLRHVDLLPREHRAPFGGYLDLLCRFVKSTDKGNFRNMNNVDRLIARFADKELAASVNAVFPG